MKDKIKEILKGFNVGDFYQDGELDVITQQIANLLPQVDEDNLRSKIV